MKTLKSSSIVIGSLLATVLCASGCGGSNRDAEDADDQTAEQAGEEADDAAEDVEDSAEDVGDKAEDAADNAEDEADEVD